MIGSMPDGVYPVMLTPFLRATDASAPGVDYPCLAKLSDWYIRSGAVGLFTVAQSSEMYSLTPDERLECAKTVKAAAAGRVPVLASGTFEGTVEEQANFVNRMATDADVVVVLVCNLAAKDESDEVWIQRCTKLLELTPGVTLGLYECPAPYHRLLTPAMLKWCAASGRFAWIKDTSRENSLISAKIEALKPLDKSPLKWYNGNVTTLLHSLREGSHGYSGVSGNFYPWMHVWLCAHWNKDTEKAIKVQRFLTVAEALVKTMYPASAKVYLAQSYSDFEIQPTCRVRDFTFLPEDRQKLRELQLMMEDLCMEIGIEPVLPGKFTSTSDGACAAAGAGDSSAFPVD
eukprot:m.84474 g.84474  ORF g.84474 m.84474 type:complete len:345 (+) comp11310_c0_seq1:48-1082(+)